MIPISLTLTGFKGIRDGLGRESITIDFADLTGGAQLVAITGRNGRGKSTILDNMTPYPLMPSKASADGLGAFSYYDEVYLPENRKELTWEMDGTRYRSHLVIRDNGRRKTEAYLHTLREGAWLPVRLIDGTVSDGRMETYVRCVEGIVGATATFLTTAFSAQNRRQLASYRNAEIKGLLADLLGLAQIRALGEQANDTLRMMRAGLVSLRQTRAHVQSESQKLAHMADHQGDIKKQSALALRNKQLATECRDARSAELAALQVRRELSRCHEERRKQLQEERQSTLYHAKEALTHLDSQDRGARAGLSRLQAQAAQRKAQHETNIASLHSQRISLMRTIHSGRHVDRAVRRKDLLRKILAERDDRLEHAQKLLRQHEALLADAALKEANLQAIEREAGQAVLAVQELRRRYALTGEVPCAGTPMQQGCKLLVDARAAKPLLPDASAKVNRLNDAYRSLRREIDALKAQVPQSAGVEASFRLAKSKRCRTEARLSWELQLAARQNDIAQARTSLTDVELRLASLESARPIADADESNEQLALQRQLDEIAGRRTRELAKQNTAIERLDALLRALPPVFDDAALARAVTAAAQAEAALSRADQAHQTAIGAAQRQQDLVQRIEECRGRLAELDEHIARIEAQIGRWTLFAKCMGNDGIVALVIDDAGPELSTRANQLLLACYGARFTVSINTLLATSAGNLKEGFEITVHDAWRNTAKNVAKMSGGERIWINECLTRAMALYLAEAAGRRSGTLFSDEADGAFDAQHKRQFMAMKREVLRIGGYTQEYFISHTPELSERADAVIDLDQFATGDAEQGVIGQPGPC